MVAVYSDEVFNQKGQTMHIWKEKRKKEGEKHEDMEVQFPFEILWFKRSLLLKVEDGGDGGAIGHSSNLLK